MTRYASQETFYDCNEHTITLNECDTDRHENIATRWWCPVHKKIVHVEYDNQNVELPRHHLKAANDQIRNN